MRLSPAAEYAIRGSVVLAENHGGPPISISSVCEARQMGKEYLTKIFSALTRAGLLTPMRGKGGGYRLARDPSDITLREIIEAVEGPIALNFCQHDPPQCDEDECRLRLMWSDLQETMVNRLGSVTLAHAVNGNGHSHDLPEA